MLTHTPHIQAVDAYTLAFAHGIIASLARTPELAPTIQLLITQQNWEQRSRRTSLKTQSNPLLVPPDQLLQTTQWLTAIASPQTHPCTTTALSEWAQNYIAPKDAVIGIVGIAIIGPTLGILDKPKKKKKAELPIIIEANTFRTYQKGQLVSVTTQLAQRTIAHDLRLAGGNVYRLHPETAEWSLEAGESELYVVEKSVYAALDKMLADSPFATQKHEEDAILAISPAIATTVIENFSLTRLSQ